MALVWKPGKLPMGLPMWSHGKEPVCHAGDTRCPWVRKIPWRRKWQPTPVSWPGEFHGQRSLAGYSPQGRKESDTAEQLSLRAHRASRSYWQLLSQTGLRLLRAERRRHFKRHSRQECKWMKLTDLENKSVVNFREELFRHRGDKKSSLGKREAENWQQTASSEHPTQFLGGTACQCSTKILRCMNKSISFSGLRMKLKQLHTVALPRAGHKQWQINHEGHAMIRPSKITVSLGKWASGYD